MNPADMIGFVDALQKRLLRRMDLSGADYADIVDNELRLKALRSFEAELKTASASEGVAWLIARMAQLEARVDALTCALRRIETPAGEGRREEEAPPPAETPEKVVIAMDENIAQSGFYYVERADDGRCFRWLGPQPAARVYLPKMKPPLELTLFVTAVYKGVALADIRVSLNGGPWSAVEMRRIDEMEAARCRLTSGPDDDGALHHIDIDCGATYSPADEGGTDARRIGVALSRIEIVSV